MEIVEIGVAHHRVIAMAIAMIGRIIGPTGDRHQSIACHAIAPRQSIGAAAMRMYAGVITAIGPTGLTTILSSPITAHAASAIHHIFKTRKAPDNPGLFQYSHD